MLNQLIPNLAPQNVTLKELDGYLLTKADIATAKISLTVSVDAKRILGLNITFIISPSREIWLLRDLNVPHLEVKNLWETR